MPEDETLDGDPSVPSPAELSRQILETLPDAVIIVDAAGSIRVVNGQAVAMFGYAPGELIGTLIEALVPAAFRAGHPAHRKAYLADPRTRPMGAGLALAGLRKDGVEFPIDVSLSSVETDEGLLVSATVHDVTDRKIAERAAAALAAIVRSSSDAIIGKTPDGTITSWNPAAERIYGHTEAEAIGRSVDILIPPELLGEHNDLMQRVLGGDQVEHYETKRTTKDGRVIDVFVTLSAIVDKRRQLVGVSTISRDISDRKKAEARFQRFLENAPDAIVAVNGEGVIRLVNQQVEAMFGYGREELMDQPVELLVPDSIRLVHRFHRRKYFSDPRTRPMGAGLELAGRKKDGTEFPVDVSLSALETDEGLMVSAAIRDVTERVRAEHEHEMLEAELRLAQRAQSQRIEGLGQLTGGIAHDFNNLLAVILNYAGFVLEDIDNQDEVRTSVQAIREAAQRAADLTRKLLIFGRREVVTPVVMDTNALVSELDKLLGRTLGEHVDVQTRLEPRLWLVKADPSGLEQVLMNLAINARDAMSGGGVLTIETFNVELVESIPGNLGDLEPGRYVRIRVSDSGEGMSEEAMARAFEPFFTTKPMGLGSGLGLATVYGVITQAGGHVHLESTPGSGTVVDIYLPATNEKVAVQSPAPKQGSQAGGGETILVVEDEDAVRDIACRLLGRNGYTVITAPGGLEAVSLAEQHDGPIDLVLTDVVMPQMSGRELAAALRELRPSIKVLYMSGYPEDFIVDQGVGEPGLVIVDKPFTEPVLLQKLREMLDAPSGEAQAGRSRTKGARGQ